MKERRTYGNDGWASQRVHESLQEVFSTFHYGTSSIIDHTQPQPQPQMQMQRRMDENNEEEEEEEEYYEGDQVDDEYNADDDLYNEGDNDDDNVNEACTKFLVTFLRGVTDAKDQCEGITNAYTAAGCARGDTYSSNVEEDYGDYDDYFTRFYESGCCHTLMSNHKHYCDNGNMLSSMHLLVASVVLLLCECAKYVVKSKGIHYLPEAGVCILVGTFCGFIAHLIPGASIDDMTFDAELFMSVLLPPIIFEAALSVSKYEFKRRRGAIFLFAVFGTIISTFSTGLMVHYGSMLTGSHPTLPMLDSLVFGALISSIDPVAILSVLSNLNLDQTDTIFILVFGESLLNDGIAITTFKTLVDRFDGKTNDGSTSLDEVLDAVATFLQAMFGSIFIGLLCGCGAWLYFRTLSKHLPPVMEVGSFFLWALIPYYICEEVNWSGIVAIVVMGFFMDIYIAAPKKKKPSELDDDDDENNSHSDYMHMDERVHTCSSAQSIRPLSTTERIHLSTTADKHVRFVAHLTSQLAESAIFSYLGLFLLSQKYDWDPALVSIGIVSCVLSRGLMVVLVSNILGFIYRWRGLAPPRSGQPPITGVHSEESNDKPQMSRTAAAISDRRTQLVLVMAGLRGAVSLALVENVPLYNTMTGEGCEYKQIMKGMTSGAILFTTFVFGGGGYYLLPHLGISTENQPSDAGSDQNSIQLTRSASMNNSTGSASPGPSPTRMNTMNTMNHTNKMNSNSRPMANINKMDSMDRMNPAIPPIRVIT
eukprot:CAMPEP_0198290670 /NCGR_PEP_ID=MMETSP1449-20131203/8444_1 /TAXON_ID=420275 /ORGANISM="Attheya septentrionalis, Strain CCMP2084" /LENGTH=761 /DNA_ID=CAMNT_0043989199 /DNA_START=313 /DNA_END=2598 /DNA_ORIENTATION=-